jgi:hypothetical protein
VAFGGLGALARLLHEGREGGFVQPAAAPERERLRAVGRDLGARGLRRTAQGGFKFARQVGGEAANPDRIGPSAGHRGGGDTVYLSGGDVI